MYERFTDRARKVMQLANQEAQRFNHEYIGTEHILLGLVKEGAGVAANVLKNLEIDLRKIRLEVERICQTGPDSVTTGKLPQTARAKKVIEYSIEEARALNHNYVGTEHLLLGLLREQQGVAAQVLVHLGLKLATVRDEILKVLAHSGLLGKDAKGASKLAEQPKPKRRGLVDAFARNLLQLARRGVFDPVIGRQRELEQLVEVLCRQERSHALLVGEPGVGKTAIVEGLARRIAEGSVPEALRDRPIFAVDLAPLAPSASGLVLALQTKRFLESALATKNSLLLIDNVHVLLSAPNTRPLDEVFRPVFASGELQCVATTVTVQFVEGLDAIFRAPLRRIDVAPLTAEQTLEVLRQLRPRDEAVQCALITDEALTAAIELAPEQVRDYRLPGGAIRLLQSAILVARDRSNPLPGEIVELDVQINRLQIEKETAVAAGDFEQAAMLRDRIDKFRKQREQLHVAWIEKRREPHAVVDRAAVMEVLTKEAGT